MLYDVLPRLEAEAAKLGLQLNKTKCAVLVPGSDLGLPDEFLPGVPRVSASACLPVPGSPVGKASACFAWAETNLANLSSSPCNALVPRPCPVGRALAVATTPLFQQK